MRAATLAAVCALVAVGAEAGSAKTAAKGKPTSGSTFVGETHTVGSKTYAAGSGIDKLLGPGAVTLAFTTAPTSQPNVVKVTAKPMIIWMRTGTFKGSGTLLLNVKTGAITDGHAAFKGNTGTLRGHSLVVSLSGQANLAKGQFHYTYHGVYK
jgi:hypothetical protein